MTTHFRICIILLLSFVSISSAEGQRVLPLPGVELKGLKLEPVLEALKQANIDFIYNGEEKIEPKNILAVSASTIRYETKHGISKAAIENLDAKTKKALKYSLLMSSEDAAAKKLSQRRTAEQKEIVKDLKVLGVRLGMTISEFNKAKPEAAEAKDFGDKLKSLPNYANADIRWKEWLGVAPDGRAANVFVGFKDGIAVSCVAFYYVKSNQSDLGFTQESLKDIYDTYKEGLGRPDSDDPNANHYHYSFYEENIRIWISLQNIGLIIGLEDLRFWNSVQYDKLQNNLHENKDSSKK